MAVPNRTTPDHVRIASSTWTAVKRASRVMAGVFDPGSWAVRRERNERVPRCWSIAQGARAHDASLNSRTYAACPCDVNVAGSAPIRSHRCANGGPRNLEEIGLFGRFCPE